MDSLEFSGLVALLDPPRAGVRDSICTLQNSGVKVCMVTGDGRETAMSISSMLGLEAGGSTRLMAGAEVDAMSDAQLEKVASDQPKTDFSVSAENEYSARKYCRIFGR
jgi:Ca2+-transporting ATPase